MAHILVIDDEQEILEFIKIALERDGHLVQTATKTTDISFEKIRFADLILLDVMMPDEDGFSYCERIRNMVDCPILFVTAKTSENDLIHGLGIGADDYIQKPFSVAELRARVSAHLRRETREQSHAIRVGDFTLDLVGKEIHFQDHLIVFTKSEYMICSSLIENAGQVFSKGQIYELVFGFDGASEENVIVEHIKNIRAKLKTYGTEPIETVWGIGYRWKKEKLSV